MVQVIEKETPYGKLAENLGRSLGESTGREMKRQQVVSGVKNLADQLSQNGGEVDRVQMLTSLYGIPNMDPQTMNMLLPALESSIRSRSIGRNEEKRDDRSFSTNDTQNAPSARAPDSGLGYPSTITSNQITEKQGGLPQDQVTQKPQEKTTTLALPGDVEALQQKEINLTDNQKWEEAYRLMKRKPGLHSSIEGYKAAIDEDVNAKNADIREGRLAATKREELTTGARTKYTNKVSQRMQRAGLSDTWAEIPGNIQESFIADMIPDIKGGMTIEDAADKASKKSLNFARKSSDFKKVGSRGIVGPGSQDLIKDLSQYRSMYEEQNALPEYFYELKQKGLGDFTAASIAYPLSMDTRKELAKLNDDVKKVTASKNKPKGLYTNYSTEIYSVPSDEAYRKSEAAFKKITNTDSIYSIVGALNDAGIKEDMAYQAARDLVSNKAISLTARQDQELSQALPVDPTIQDLWGWTGLTDQGKYGFFEGVKRKLGKR